MIKKGQNKFCPHGNNLWRLLPFFKMLVGDFMIDDTNYADCLACEEAFDTKK